jgi:PAS domain S-box-containing protein
VRKLFKEVFAHSAMGVIIADPEGRLFYANAAYSRFLGYREDELSTGRCTLSQLTHPEDLDLHRREYLRLVTGEIPAFSIEKRCLRKDGAPVWVRENASVRGDVAGHPLEVIELVEDIDERKRVDEVARANEEKFRLVVESVPTALVMVDEHGRIVLINPQTEKLFGYSRDELLGKPVEMLVPAASRTQHVHDRKAFLHDLRGRPMGAGRDLYGLRKDGGKVPVEIGLNPIVTGTGVLVLAAIVDISERKRAEARVRESEERFRTLADNIAQLAWIADKRGSIVWYNRRWLDYTGMTLAEAQGSGWQKVHHPDHLQRVMARRKHSVETGEIWEDTFPLRGKDGQYRWFLSRAIPIRNTEGQVQRWFGTNTDITEERLAQEALEQADRRKDEFLAILAHELRNPMAAISAATRLLSVPHLTEEHAALAKESLERRVQQLARLVDDLLDVSRIARGKILLHRENLDLAIAVERAVEATRPFFEDRKQTLKLEVRSPLLVSGDVVRLEQVATNLLVNAAKYTENGGEIVLTAIEEEGSAVLRVKDNGIGMPADLLPKVFDLFGQAESSLHRSQGGLGVGLSIVKKLVEMHGGTVSAHSEGPGKGSEFVVRLALIEAKTVPDTREQEPHKPRNLRILIAEDHRDTALMSAATLEIEGHSADIAYDGTSAVRMALELRPDVILLDIGLPGLNGFEVAEQLRRNGLTNTIIIAVTGYGQERDREQARRSGIDQHLLKPVDYDRLKSLLNQVAEAKDSEHGRSSPEDPAPARGAPGR